jgi:hypothetical protein
MILEQFRGICTLDHAIVKKVFAEIPLIRALFDSFSLVAGGNENAFSWIARVGAAYITSIITVLLSQPGDVLYTGMIAAAKKQQISLSSLNDIDNGQTMFSSNNYDNDNNIDEAAFFSPTVSLSDLVVSIYKTYGLAGFYRGLVARMLHSSWVITAQLVMYDIFKNLFGL